ncbi:flavoprotein [Kitasatospora sp. NPDC004723]|uniref:flavoprotein n=1 Tax=Kitasatospora sp. NPDC004723 TaxID=3154288 RepID=UPI0033B6C0AC
MSAADQDRVPGSVGTSGAPAFGARRLLLVGSGALGAASLPFWINWLRLSYPDLDLRVVLTRAAERFVTRNALTPILGREVLQDVWSEEPEASPLHVDLAQWPDAIAVYPASLHYIARLSIGLPDTPSQMALQTTRAPLVIAPALPPDAVTSPVYLKHLAELQSRANIVVVPPHKGLSVSSRQPDGSPAAPLTGVIESLERLRTNGQAQG